MNSKTEGKKIKKIFQEIYFQAYILYFNTISILTGDTILFMSDAGIGLLRSSVIDLHMDIGT